MSGLVQDFVDRLAEQHAKSQNARNRITALLDENSFVETGVFVTQRSTAYLPQDENISDGVICGHGLIDGRLVFVYCQDNSVLGGSIGEMHAKKIEAVYENALKMGAPVIGIIDSKGVRLTENVDALHSLGTVYYSMSKASGVVPQISVILGGCMGGMSFVPALSDFVFMTEKDSLLFMSSPSAIKGVRTTSYDQLGGGRAHAVETGLASVVAPDENSLFEQVKDLVSFLPSNNMDDGVIMLTEQSSERKCYDLDEMCENGEINTREIIVSTSDNQKFYELTPDFAKGVITGFSRFKGVTAGIVAAEGNLCGKCISKAASFVNFCDCFNIPVITFTNVTGFMPLMDQSSIINNGARLIHAFCAATVPKINIIAGNAYGSAYIAMNSKHIGADLVYAWPSGKISVMDAEASVNVMLSEEIKSAENSIAFAEEKIKEYEETMSSPYTAAARGYIDALIAPSDTREAISAALETLYSKRVLSPSRKHGSFS